MKRVKRLFACLLALTMMLGLSATAFATETAEKVQTPANGGTVTFEKEYKLVGEGISPAETFEFNIAKAGVENGGVDAEKQDMPTVGTAAYAQNGATTAGYSSITNLYKCRCIFLYNYRKNRYNSRCCL